MDFAWGYATDTRQRGENQDCHGVFQFSNCLLSVVCDGMGGHAGGAQASALAVRTIYDTIEDKSGSPIRTALAEAIRKANRTIYETGRKSHRLQGMGTTVVAAAIEGDVAHVAHVGDSRVLLIRDGSIRSLTRDHTMVNMFVDHDLLSPEDAASHPEAHVLARSLGVERQVDIEFHEPIQMQSGDILILCSDGVHGVLSEETLRDIDWSKPQGGVQEALKLVADGDGTDNATVIGIAFGVPSSMSDPVTEPPAAERIEDHLTPSSQGPIRAPALLNEPQPPALFSVDPAEPTPPFAPRNESEQVIEAHPDESEVEESDPASDLRRQKSDPKDPKKETKKRWSAVNLMVSVGIVLLLFGASGLVIAMIYSSMDFPELPSEIASQKTPTEDGQTEVAPDTEDVVTNTRVETTVDTTPEAKLEEQHWYAPTQRPEAAIRTRPTQYTNPAPGGSHSKTIVEAARNGECSTALSRLETALKDSSDYALLYKKVWRCYTYSHQRPLKAKLSSWKEMRALVPHFQGNSQVINLSETEAEKPYWYRNANGGIEQRLNAWTKSVLGEHLMGDVVRDHFSQEVVATNLANDLLIEASAALALSRVQNPPDEVIQWWARRLFIAQTYWENPAGQIVRGYHPSVVEPFERMLNEASRGLKQHWEASGMVYDASRLDDRWKAIVEARGLPIEVGEALLVAKGYIPPPDQRMRKPTAAELKAIRRRNALRGTGAPTGELDLSIMNEARTWNKHERTGRE